MGFITMLLTAILTQQVISWAGRCIHNFGESNLQYAYFIFSDERNVPMTTNVLMNIFIPNIVMVFLYDLYKIVGWNFAAERIYLFTVIYFIWRAFLIIVILKRKEFYKCNYEFGLAGITVLLSLIIYWGFLIHTDSFFIKTDELREELGFAIIIILYEFIKYILENRLKQENVILEEDLQKYIERKYVIFNNRYRSVVSMNEKNRNLWIFIFSIMIFEDFNRGPFIRFFEYIFVLMGRTTTIGIMQVKSDKFISSKKSIQVAYDMISEHMREQQIIEISEDDVYGLATWYNCDERYGENVCYIYMVLQNYIMPSENKNEPMIEEDEISASSVKEMVKCTAFSELAMLLKNDASFVMEKKEEDILFHLMESKHIRVERVFDGWQVVLRDLDNVEIDGKSSYLYSKFNSAAIFKIVNCSNLVIKNLKLAHFNRQKVCEGAVVVLEDSFEIKFEGVELCDGTYGISSINSNFTITDSGIHHCKNGAINAKSSQVTINNCKIYSCNIEVNDLILVDGHLEMTQVEIFKNHADIAIINADPYDTELSDIEIYNNQYRNNYFFDTPIETMLKEKNEHLGWSE